MTPKQIIDFAQKNPAALEQLIASFGYECYRAAINDMTRSFADAATCSIPERGVTAILISNHHLEHWKSGEMCKWKHKLEETPPARLKIAAGHKYVSNCCDAPMADPLVSDYCPKCREHCEPVLEDLDEMI